MSVEVINGECVSVMRGLPDCSVDSCVTDPPYGLNFMGKAWDYDVPKSDVWREVLRVLKPGAHLLAFFGTRTYHRGVVQIEDAGFEIRDMIGWMYGSGFPKSHNLDGEHEGWGTALKPAHEPIVMARKPLEGTVAANVQKWGTGAINVDGCRISTNPNVDDSRLGGGGRWSTKHMASNVYAGGYKGDFVSSSVKGRWPANLIHDGSQMVMELFPITGASSVRPPTGKPLFATSGRAVEWNANSVMDTTTRGVSDGGGSAARFFYCAKASRSERDAGLDEATPQMRNDGRDTPIDNPYQRGKVLKNHHPTVKPIALMRYLCRLVTPPNGTTLDPFAGSGTTGIAATEEGFSSILIEIDPIFAEIAHKRTDSAMGGGRDS